LLTVVPEVLMYARAAAAIFAVGLMTGVALAQTRSDSDEPQTTVTVQNDVPTYHVTIVGRRTQAINFRPRKGETKIDFKGTELSPKAHGDATIKGEKGYIVVDANFETLEPPSKFGNEYLTYVLWAITPEGRTENIGELQVSGDDGELKVSTELQAFGLIVTAEPYFAVTQPSNVVVLEGKFRLEGVFKDQTLGTAEVVDAKYELLNRGTYLMNHTQSDLKRKALEPGAPLDLAEARNAVEIARLNGADKYAAETFNKAASLLSQAELAREQRKKGNEVQQPARQAVQTAEDARLIAVKRMQEEEQARQRAILAQREEDARLQALREADRARAERDRAAAEEARRLLAEQERQTAEAARLAAERAKADADAAAQQARLDAEAVAARAKADADAAAAKFAQEQQAAEAARLAAEKARADAEAQARQAQASAEAAERERAELREKLRQQLNSVLETRETARGLIVNISDVLFDVDKATLKPGAREKLARVAGILQAQPGINVSVEGHADSTGATSYNQRLSERRASSVRDYIVSQGIQPGTVATAGYGETRPVATNDTAAGRQQNRRVELVVSGDAITSRTTTTTTTTTTTPAPADAR
jgi:outer membrane protein OmpA-like peptidoglycan-associated protein